MNEIVQDYIEDYIRHLIPSGDQALKILRSEAKEQGIPMIHPEVEQHLKLLIQSKEVQSILEIGTAVGYSAAVFAKSMGDDGQVDTIERSFKMLSQATNNIEMLDLKKQVHLILGDAQEEVENLKKNYDMIFLDGAKGHYIHLLEPCLKRLNPGGLLVSDNVLFKGMIASDRLVIRRKITIVKRMRNYLETISDHPQLVTSILPLGDGLAVSWKKKERP